ncbi:MAG TPA: endo alpha-1,4 polygalactosaminidase [Hyphomicrobiaceae bacterium]|nr:endo alpha-1,4 polygalactosaminidase [Hyphomicrobiaceae bacterium]
MRPDATTCQSLRGLAIRAMLLALFATGLVPTGPALAARPGEGEIVAPAPRPAIRPPRPGAPSNAVALAERLKRIGAVKSWGYQLNGLNLEAAAASPYDLLIVDATTGLASGRPFEAAEVERLKRKPDGSRRLVVSYLSIGEAEDYRPEYFSPEYMSEDAPDWLMHENPQWKGNRIIRFCNEGWQLTILGDERGRSVYNSIDPSPLFRLIELGFDGVYLDRVDVYKEVAKECGEAERRMVDFVSRLARHARRKEPHFLVIMQNAEELARQAKLIEAIDAVAKEDLFYGADHSERQNEAGMVRTVLDNLRRIKAANRPVFVVDYLKDRTKIDDAKRRILDAGFVPYIAPRALDRLWLPGRDF